MNNLYDVLEVCLQEIEQGADLDTLLTRYPDFAEELRPILESSIKAKQMSIPEPSADVVRRNRAKLLQHAAQMRETKSVTKSWFPTFQRLAIAFVLLMLFFVSGTSLVRASSSALPGDNLYPVKRSWEDATLFFTFDKHAQTTLQVEYENERLDEINKLFTSGRPASVDFSGVITRQNGNELQIANILVMVSSQTKLSNQTLTLGMAVHVLGTTDGNGIVTAEQIEVLPAGAPLPVVTEDQSVIETEQPQATSQPGHGKPTQESNNEAPEIKVTIAPSSIDTPQMESFKSTLSSINNDVWQINNIPMNVANAEIKGVPMIGAQVNVEGYYGADGIFIAVKVEFINNGSSNDSGNLNLNNVSNDGSSNLNSNSESSNNNDGNSGGGDNSGGSGGGDGSGGGNGG